VIKTAIRFTLPSTVRRYWLTWDAGAAIQHASCSCSTKTLRGKLSRIDFLADAPRDRLRPGLGNSSEAEIVAQKAHC
jgi:hypothetical protein